MNEAAAYLKDGVTLVVVKERKVKTFEERGITTLLFLLGEQRETLRGATVADAIVGRAAALLMVEGDVKNVHAAVLSSGARDVFERYGVTYSYDILTEMIVDRSGTGQCPMELTVAGIDNPTTAYSALKAKAASMLKPTDN